MAHTNSTPNYNLPQFLGTDKPAWLTDINNAMSDIDTAIAAAKTTADTADTAVTGLAVTVGNHTSQLSSLSGAVTSQGNTLNTVTSLIGNGTPTTTDQTIIGAINELNAGKASEYEFIGQAASVTITGYKEIYAVVHLDADIRLTFTILAAELSGTAQQYRSGYYQSASVNGMAQVGATNTTVSFLSAYLNGSSVTSDVTVYGRK